MDIRQNIAKLFGMPKEKLRQLAIDQMTSKMHSEDDATLKEIYRRMITTIEEDNREDLVQCTKDAKVRSQELGRH